MLLFVGLASADISVVRVSTRRSQDGHDVPEDKLRSRFQRTQKAIGIASGVADLTLMFDNSRDMANRFTLSRAQMRSQLLYDCRTTPSDPDLVNTARVWLDIVAPL